MDQVWLEALKLAKPACPNPLPGGGAFGLSVAADGTPCWGTALTHAGLICLQVLGLVGSIDDACGLSLSW